MRKTINGSCAGFPGEEPGMSAGSPGEALFWPAGVSGGRALEAPEGRLVINVTTIKDQAARVADRLAIIRLDPPSFSLRTVLIVGASEMSPPAAPLCTTRPPSP